MRALILAGLIIASGSLMAAEPEVVQLSPDTYMIIRENKAGIFGSLPKTKIKVIKQANEFAAAQGKIAIPISTEERRARGPGQWPSVEYQFRVVDKADPEARRTSLEPRADVVVSVEQPGQNPQPASAPEPQRSAVYDRLIELEDLRKRGILTDDEFEREKKKLLDSN